MIRITRWLLTPVFLAYFAHATSPRNRGSYSPLKYSIRLPGHAYQEDDADNGDSGLLGTGREFELFRSDGPKHLDDEPGGSTPRAQPSYSRGGGSNSDGSSYPLPRSSTKAYTPPPSYFSNNRSPFTGMNRSRFHSQPQPQERGHSIFSPVTNFWRTNIAPSMKNWPKIQCRVEPTTTLKLRKTFRPLGTIVRLGADFNTQLGVWQFRSSWEDAIIGGKLTLLSGKELQLTKSWQLSVGAMEDLVTRLRFRAAVDLQTYKAYARVGFRTERLTPINVMEGFTLLKQLPLDGNKGHVKLEVKANLSLPEPEIEYSTATQRSVIGMGDVEVNIEELNLVLDY